MPLNLKIFPRPRPLLKRLTTLWRRLAAPTLGLGLVGLVGLVPFAQAQTAGGSAVITHVDTSAFPAMQAYVAVNDKTGAHVGGLTASAFALTEGAQLIPTLAVSEQEVGVQMVFALDLSDGFKVRDPAGFTRLDYFRQNLAAFAAADPRFKDAVDNISIVTPAGLLLSHCQNGTELAQTVLSYTTDFAPATDAFALLSLALDLAADPPPHPAAPRHVVFLSSGLSSPDIEAALSEALAHAQATRTVIHTVYVGPASSGETVSANRLKQLSAATGGLHLTLDQSQALTPLLNRFVDQRAQYQLAYRSLIQTTGQYPLVLSLTLTNSITLTTSAFAFPMRIEAPTLTLGPPAEINLADTPVYSVPVNIDFPDGHPRQVTLELLADGTVVNRGPQSPLPWPLAGYAPDSTHALQARLIDELGLAAESPVITVTLTSGNPGAATPTTGTSPPQPGFTNRQLLFFGLLGLIALVTIGGLWVARQTRHVKPLSAPESTRPSRAALPSDPPSKKASALRRPLSPHTPAEFQPRGRAYLEVLEPGGGGLPRDDIEILAPAVRLGRDVAQAEIIFPDRSVSRLHAQIAEMPDGTFRLYDQKSTSGTWVNFAQILLEEGSELKDGDVINLGRVQLRFHLRSAVGMTLPRPRPQGRRPAAVAASQDYTQPHIPFKPKE